MKPRDSTPPTFIVKVVNRSTLATVMERRTTSKYAAKQQRARLWKRYTEDQYLISIMKINTSS